jgi:hypothetical protein
MPFPMVKLFHSLAQALSDNNSLEKNVLCLSLKSLPCGSHLGETLLSFIISIWYVESLVKSTSLDRVCFNFTLDSCRVVYVARLTSGRVNL